MIKVDYIDWYNDDNNDDDSNEHDDGHKDDDDDDIVKLQCQLPLVLSSMDRWFKSCIIR